MNKIFRGVVKLNEDKTKFTLKHAQIFFQTIADILGEKYNVKVIAKVEEKQ